MKTHAKTRSEEGVRNWTNTVPTLSSNGNQKSSTFWKDIGKKASRNWCENMQNGTTKRLEINLPRCAGSWFRRAGVGWFSIWFLAVVWNLTRPAPGGCGGCFLIQNGYMGLLASDFKILVRWSLPDEPTNPNKWTTERPMAEKVDSGRQQLVRFGAEGSLQMKRMIVYWGDDRLSHTTRGRICEIYKISKIYKIFKI